MQGIPPSRTSAMRLACLLLLLLACAGAPAATPRTLRVDIQHSGDARSEQYALERVVLEPLPWPGNPSRPLDDSNRGAQKFEVADAATGKVLYSRGYSTVFGEWYTTAEGASARRSFQESLRFPLPARPVKLTIFSRDAANAFVPTWSVAIDPAAPDVQRSAMPLPTRPRLIHGNGEPAHKVDLLLLGDGYTAAEMDTFEARARALAAHLFSVSPFKERAADFNVWALAVPTPESGISRPSGGVQRASSTGATYDVFGLERYVLTLDNRAFRELAQHAPYDVVEIVVNGQTYGGGGIFGQFSTVAADNAFRDYLFVHEFGHHFAGLADEYYTSPVAYAPLDKPTVEPWEPNVTALLDPKHLKWARRGLSSPLPTPWPKAAFEVQQRTVQAQRAKLRADRRPEAEMDALLAKSQDDIEALFAEAPYRDAIGAFQGANYSATGFYRPQLQCLMFTRADAFCDVCRHAVEEIIDLYSSGAH
jgi:hypothetical protein